VIPGGSLTCRARLTAVLAAVVLVVVTSGIAACSSGPPVATNAVPPPASDDPRTMYVAMGGNETLNRGVDDVLRRAWTQQVFTTALGPSAVYVNLASTDATVREGLSEQLPKALDLKPTVATIWFGGGDAQVHTTDSGFVSDLTEIVSKLLAAGTTKVLLISRVNSTGGDDTRYADDIKQVATSTGVDFLPIEGESNLRDPATQQAIADAVMSKLRG
jgi:hypothetical protein